MSQSKLTCCAACGQFVRSELKNCTFCNAKIVRHRRIPGAAKWGVAAAVSMLGMGAVMGCAYGGPPADCTTTGCSSNYVCDTQTRTCVPNTSESPGTENVTTDGGTSE